MKIDGAIEVRGIIFPDGTKLEYNPATGRVEWDTASAGTPASTYTQTYSTADATHATDGSTDVAAADAVAAPAGGTGATAGAYDTAANRDAAIAVINSLVTLANENKADFNLLRATVTDLKQLVNSIIDDLQAAGIVE